MKLIKLTLATLIGTSHGFYTSKVVDQFRSISEKALEEAQKNTLDEMFQYQQQRYGAGPGSPSESEEEEELHYPAQAGTGAAAIMRKQQIANERAAAEEAARDEMEINGMLRSSSSGEESGIMTPMESITEAKNDNIMILSSDYMYVSNCLLKNRHADDPVRQNAFDLFRQTAAGDWFIVFGYVCDMDYRCWKKSVGNLLSKKGENHGGSAVGRCVGRLVREKAEGLRARKRRSIKQIQRRSTTSIQEDTISLT